MHALCAAAAKAFLPAARVTNRPSSAPRPRAPSAMAASTNDACCGASAALPVKLDYEPRGKIEKLSNGTECYFVGTPTKAALVMVPDIFGIREFRQSTQAADLLAAAVPGLGVAHPDVFRGAPWPMAQFPPKDKDAFGAFIARHPYDDANVRGDVAAAFAALDARAKEAAGGGGGGGAASSSPIRLTMGFCWGALMALQANGDAELGVSASACPHPTFFGREAEMGKNLRGPVLLLPAKGDPAEAVVAAAQAAGLPFAQQCRVRRFDDQVHGFMAARGDYGDEAVRQAAGEGVGEVAAFFAGVVSGGGGGGGGGGGSA